MGIFNLKNMITSEEYQRALSIVVEYTAQLERGGAEAPKPSRLKTVHGEASVRLFRLLVQGYGIDEKTTIESVAHISPKAVKSLRECGQKTATEFRELLEKHL